MKKDAPIKERLKIDYLIRKDSVCFYRLPIHLTAKLWGFQPSRHRTLTVLYRKVAFDFITRYIE